MRRIRTLGLFLITLVAGAGIMLPLVGPSQGDPSYADLVFRNGLRDTGAPNLVTSIYLGYRAFDTLGETIVFMIAVSGVIRFIGRGE